MPVIVHRWIVSALVGLLGTGIGCKGGGGSDSDREPMPPPVLAERSPEPPSPITAPLVVHPTNPRWFADGAGRAVRLAGHQMFAEFQDTLFSNELTLGPAGAAPTLDWSWYLDWLTAHGLNFIRGWIVFSVGKIPHAEAESRYTTPTVYARTGPGLANDGRPTFDLEVWNEVFFDRMRQRLVDARDRGVYVSVMLFEVYNFLSRTSQGTLSDNFGGNYFNAANNTQGLHADTNGDGHGLEFFYAAPGSPFRTHQERWTRKVVDTVGDLPNVIYEVANELGSTAFQRDVITWVREQERVRGFDRHVVWMSAGGRVADGSWSDAAPSEFYAGPADAWGFGQGWPGYETPPANDRDRPGFWDGDHNWPADWQHHGKAWMAFTRGYHYVLYDQPFEEPARESPAFERHRTSIGATNRFAGLFRDLAEMVPSGHLTSTEYALAGTGDDYLVYQPIRGQAFTVALPAGDWSVTWYDPNTATYLAGGHVAATGSDSSFRAPFDGDAVLYLSSR